jgi:hypothetical protein
MGNDGSTIFILGDVTSNEFLFRGDPVELVSMKRDITDS